MSRPTMYAGHPVVYVASESIDPELRDELHGWQTASAHSFHRFEDSLPDNPVQPPTEAGMPEEVRETIEIARRPWGQMPEHARGQNGDAIRWLDADRTRLLDRLAHLTVALETAVQQAVEAEREACAQIADEGWRGYGDTDAPEIAANIRARSTPTSASHE